MHKFAVFDSKGPAETWPLRHANMIGVDDVAVHSNISFEAGLIRCARKTAESAGLSLQFEVDRPDDSWESPGLGLVTLQTCLLPERSRPYLLSLELARHRHMQLLNKLEDWALFDLPSDDPVIELFERARKAFVEAVSMCGGPEEGDTKLGGFSLECDQSARAALALAIEAGELMARRQAENQMRKRISGELAKAAATITAPGNAITDHEAAESRNALLGTTGVILPSMPQVGVWVDPEQFSDRLQRVIAQSCDFLCMPMRWIDMEPTEERYLFGRTDRWIEWAVRKARLPVVGGPLIDFRPTSVPEWLYIWENDYETLRELVYEHVKTIVTRYRRTVSTWTVASGLHVNSNLSMSFEQVMDLTRMSVALVRKLHPKSKIQIEIDQPWGEYYAHNARSIPPLLYAEMVVGAGLSIDLLSLRIMLGQPEMGRSSRDMLSLSAILDRYAALERPLSISAVSVPSQPAAREHLGMDGALNPGYWRWNWDDETQSRWMSEALGIILSKPYIHGICWHELYDSGKAGQDSHDGLITAVGRAKPAMFRLAEIRKALRDKASPLDLPPMPVMQAGTQV